MSKRATVLFVDDEENILNSLRRGLIDEDYDCLFAVSGQQALDLLEKTPVTVIVSDMRMPGMDGLTLLKEVRVKYPKTVRIVLSGYAQLQQIITTLNQADLFKFILKPWKLESEFKGVIKQALEYSRLQEERDEFEETLKKRNQAYQGMLKKFDTIMTDARKEAEVQTLIGVSAFNAILKTIDEKYTAAMVKRELATAAVVLMAISGLTLEEKTELGIIDFASGIKDKLSSLTLTTCEIEIIGSETDVVTANYKLILMLLATLVDLLGEENKRRHIKISCQKSPGEGTFSLFIFIENNPGVNKSNLSTDFEQNLDASIALINPLLSNLMKLHHASFHCVRVNANVMAKINYLI